MLRILHDTKYDFIKYWKHAVISTVVFIVLGLALIGYHKATTGRLINESIEFTGGTEIQFKFATAPGAETVRAAADASGYHDAEITQFGEPTSYSMKVQPRAGEGGATNADSVALVVKKALETRLAGNAI